MNRISEQASGLRHLRWSREVLATMNAHFEHNPGLAQADRDRILEEVVKLRAEINHLSAAVKAYRDFLERDRTAFRGMLRVGDFLAQTADSADERADAEAIREGFAEAFAAMDRKDRAPKRQAVRAAVARVRAALAAMDRRLAVTLPTAFVESLYPALAQGGAIVADDGDGDDDAAGLM